MSFFVQHMENLWKLRRQYPHDYTDPAHESSCSPHCTWIQSDHFYMCVETCRVHECGALMCPYKWVQTQLEECGLTGHALSHRHAGLSTLSSQSTGQLPPLPISDILAHRRQLPQQEKELKEMIRNTSEWVQKRRPMPCSVASPTQMVPLPSPETLFASDMIEQHTVLIPLPTAELFPLSHLEGFRHYSRVRVETHEVEVGKGEPSKVEESHALPSWYTQVHSNSMAMIAQTTDTGAMSRKRRKKRET